MTKQGIKIKRARPTPTLKLHNRQEFSSRKAFTLIELMVAAISSVVVVLGVGFVLADSNRAWHRAYEDAHGDVVEDSFVARRAFDTVIRKASSTGYSLSDQGDWITIQYYDDPDETTPDRYATFKRVGTALDIEVGTVDSSGNPSGILTTRTICGNVSGCMFKVEGLAAQMILVLDDGNRTGTLVACGFMHN